MSKNTACDPIGRDQILNRLWELATLSHEATRGSITGQMKAIAMIVAIEGLIPPATMNKGRLPLTQPPVPPDWRPPQQSQAEGTKPGDLVAATKVLAAAGSPKVATKPANRPSSPNLDRNYSNVINPFIQPQKPSWIPGDPDSIFNAALEAMNSPRLPFSPK
jgi:hypothetical protein